MKIIKSLPQSKQLLIKMKKIRKSFSFKKRKPKKQPEELMQRKKQRNYVKSN